MGEEKGILFSLLAAFFWATNDVFNKKSLMKGYNENFVLWIRFPLGAVLTLPLGILFWDMNRTVLFTTPLWLPVEILASLLFIKGIKMSPLSISIPFFAFMPLFSSLFGYAILGEKLDGKGFIGIALILAGSFIITGGSLSSFFKMNKGSLYILLSAFLFGFNVAVGKLVIVESNPFFFSWYYCVVMTFGLLPLVGFKEIGKPENYKNPLNLPMGLFFSLGMVFYSLAMVYTLASYVASVERLAIILDVLYGRVFFGEKIGRSFWGSVLMVSGAIVLSL